MYFEGILPNDDDIGLIEGILKNSVQLLQELFAEPGLFGLHYHLDIGNKLQLALETEGPVGERFDRMIVQMHDSSPAARFERGLSGRSLRVKAQGFQELGTRLRGIVADPLKRGVVAVLKWLLSLINSFLASVGAFSGFAEGLKELKDLFENSTEFKKELGDL